MPDNFPPARPARLVQIGWPLAFVFCGLAVAAESAAPIAAAPLVVVVNGSRSEKDISVAELRKIFVGEKKFWSDNRRIQPILPPLVDESAKIKFMKAVVGQSDRDFKQAWEGKIFRGDAQAMPVRPIEHAMVVSAARSVPGAIGILDRAAFDGLPKETTTSLKVLAVEGKAAGDEGYPLN